jgi:hypothetical protein
MDNRPRRGTCVRRSRKSTERFASSLIRFLKSEIMSTQLSSMLLIRGRGFWKCFIAPMGPVASPNSQESHGVWHGTESRGAQLICCLGYRGCSCVCVGLGSPSKSPSIADAPCHDPSPSLPPQSSADLCADFCVEVYSGSP